jgi:hypothetical protein
MCTDKQQGKSAIRNFGLNAIDTLIAQKSQSVTGILSSRLPSLCIDDSASGYREQPRLWIRWAPMCWPINKGRGKRFGQRILR